MRTAAYARFSSDLQRDTSLEDQLRVCREAAARHGFTWQEAHVYSDAAMVGSLEGRKGCRRSGRCEQQPHRSMSSR
jgi:DNA invertase Pin-like site-specific DNA recombinase